MAKRVGLVGFFGWGNYGDELFLQVWHDYLGRDLDLTVMHDVLQKPYYSRPVEEAVGEVDAILIGGGDLVIPWQVSPLYWKEEYLERPVYIAGVGVPTWRAATPEVVERMRTFFQHPNVRYIAARDAESAAWIEQHLEPKVEVRWAPDLVFAAELPEVEHDPERKVLSVVTRFRRRGKDDFRHVRRLVKKAKRMGWQVRNVVLATGRTGKVDREVADQLGVRGVEIVYSEDLDVLTRAIGSSDAVASMKFHGTVVATAYGVPCIALAPSDKSRNLLRMIDRAPMLAGLDDPTLADRLTPYLLPVPRIVRDHLRTLCVDELHTLRRAIGDG